MEMYAPKSRRRILKWILWSIGGAVILGGLLFVFAVADTLGFFHEPPLRLERTGSGLTAHVEVLGEYYCPVGRIRIQESESGTVVYEAVGKQGAPEIFNFKLAAGTNTTRLVGEDSDSYNVVMPKRQNTFTLTPGNHYRLTVWGDSWTFRRASFAL
jgi:hypothetical protein